MATPLGSILRLDVNQNTGVPPFHGIPADNPFVGGGGRPEIFAWGLRNPWRISYDAPGARLWVGDVGQANFEEIDVVTGAGNYGWDCREGLHAYTGPPDGPSAACATVTGLIDPVFEYTHAAGRSITGGYVYRGPTLSSLTGRYVYADYVVGTIWALKNGLPAQTEVLLDTSHFISTFGVDEDGELLVAAYFAAGDPSKIYRITQTEVQP